MCSYLSMSLTMNTYISWLFLILYWCIFLHLVIYKFKLSFFWFKFLSYTNLNCLFLCLSSYNVIFYLHCQLNLCIISMIIRIIKWMIHSAPCVYSARLVNVLTCLFFTTRPTNWVLCDYAYFDVMSRNGRLVI